MQGSSLYFVVIYRVGSRSLNGLINLWKWILFIFGVSICILIQFLKMFYLFVVLFNVSIIYAYNTTISEIGMFHIFSNASLLTAAISYLILSFIWQWECIWTYKTSFFTKRYIKNSERDKSGDHSRNAVKPFLPIQRYGSSVSKYRCTSIAQCEGAPSGWEIRGLSRSNIFGTAY